LAAPVPLQEKVISRFADFTTPVSLRIGVGTYNINGGKHIRSIAYKDLSLADWLIESYKGTETPSLIDISDIPPKVEKPIDVYAIGFEEMVDLDAKNIVSASSDNAKAWAAELIKILDGFTLLTYHQLVGVCLFVFVRPEHASRIRDVAVENIKTGLGGAAGNKGAVGVRFNYLATSLAFVCSHFAAGQGNVSDRNADFDEAVKRLRCVPVALPL
jgi:hypothetical protein